MAAGTPGGAVTVGVRVAGGPIQVGGTRWPASAELARTAMAAGRRLIGVAGHRPILAALAELGAVPAILAGAAKATVIDRACDDRQTHSRARRLKFLGTAIITISRTIARVST
jgi:hypothetical protein